MREWIEKFRKAESGSMAIELVLVVPILTWALLSTFVYFDAFRNEANAKRAALTVADMFSREQTSIDAQFMEGARQLLQSLTVTGELPSIRTTVYRFDDDNDVYELVWSRAQGYSKRLSNSNLADLDTAGKLPVLADNDVAILLETKTRYVAPLSIGIDPFGGSDLEDMTFTTFTVIRPRFVANVCYDVSPGLAGGEIC